MSCIFRNILLFVLMAVVKSNHYEKCPDLGFYKVYNTPATWADALKTCIDDEATLLITNSNIEKNKAVDTIRNHIPSNLNDGRGIVFLGFHNLFNEDELHTASGGRFPEFHPEKREEILANRSDESDHCGAMYSDGTMTLRPCSQKLPFVCQKPLWMSYELASNNNYYKLYTDATTWSEALRTCAKDGAYLAVVSDISEASILGEMIKRYKIFPTAESNDFVAVGAHDFFKTGKVRSVLGQEVDMSILSKNGVRLENENCIYIHRIDENLYYGDCDSKFAFFCEQGTEVKNKQFTEEDCSRRYNMYRG